ncbi:MAG: isopentenyl-diphosphate Delta-isomerase [Intrasporangium sp.]|uniref:isopentenyl-diphosphate Delta-isomerase n=1 Tax=Intrasporangium sp. TaxID=1925024 RepID=UPI002647FE95|nr:isopentenyl-diphosphate Delta-isomerase [Intrasporangium sp.]MDN5794231.1 isopentenyl-diphosphate Delta-isomerase [Intrasporangium sp.]
MTSPDDELVVLLSEDGRRVGVAAKASVHGAHTPLHLAFSAYLFDARDRLLVTRRALDKATFPGVVTNSVCGHPAPGEGLEDAVRRRAADELGLPVGDLRLVLPRFAYRAEMAGVVEREMCPVLVGRVDAQPRPDPAEVASFEWVHWATFAAEVVGKVRDVSVWCRLQVEQLDRLGPGPDAWPTADEVDLPAVLAPRGGGAPSTGR